MAKSAILNSSIAKKWWMALTGLFLCLFLVGHLLGNLQMVFIHGEEGKRAFNEYAYFMTHNPLIKVMSYITYFSILFHAIDGIILTVQNKKARPKKYAYNKPGENSSLPSRYMAVLGSAILIFIVLHMANFWGKMHYTQMPFHKTERISEGQIMTELGPQKSMDTASYYLSTQGEYLHEGYFESQSPGQKAPIKIDGTNFVNTQNDLKIGEGYKDLHSLVFAFFGHDKSKEGFPINKNALIAVIIYVVAMLVLAFHLWHGFASAFQTLGINHRKHNAMIKGFGKAFAVLVPLAFAIIPILIYLNK